MLHDIYMKSIILSCNVCVCSCWLVTVNWNNRRQKRRQLC